MVVRHRVHKRPACKGGDRKAGAPSSYMVVKKQLKLEREEKEKVEKELEKELENELELKVELEKEKCERKKVEQLVIVA